jgi:hypothetical protein
MNETTQRNTTGSPLPSGFAIAAIGTLLGLKALIIFSPPLGDEAYYWMWGQELDWSYHDHPPLNAWLLRLSNELFGWNRFALRAPAILSFLVSASVIVWWGRRLAPRDMGNPGHAALAIFLASPLMFVCTTLTLPDHLLIASLLVSGHFFVLYAASVERGERRNLPLFAAALALGLAALSKYSAVFVGIGFVAWFLSTRAGRRELLTPYPWLAGTLALGMQAPVIWWNLEHNLSTLRFHFGGRFPHGWNALEIPLRLAGFLLLASLMFSPLLLPGLWRFLRNRQPAAVGHLRTVALPAFAIAMLVFSGFTAAIIALFYWVIPAVVLFYPVAIAFVAGWLRWTVAFGLFAAALVTVNLSAVPIASLFGGKSADEISYGWTTIAEWVERERARYGADLLLTSQYNLAALLGFELGRSDVYSFSARDEQYDYWFDPSRHTGESALLLTDFHNPLYGEHRQLFEKIEPIGTLTTYRFGVPLDTFTLYHGTGMREPECCRVAERSR